MYLHVDQQLRTQWKMDASGERCHKGPDIPLPSLLWHYYLNLYVYPSGKGMRDSNWTFPLIPEEKDVHEIKANYGKAQNVILVVGPELLQL